MVCLTLFFASLLAATLLPGGSEALLLYDLLHYDAFFCLLFFATAGNTLGSVINYVIARKGTTYLVERGYVKSLRLARAQSLFNRFGALALLFSWLPVLGDPVTFVAGAAKYDFRKFLALVLIAKGGRYAIIAMLAFTSDVASISSVGSGFLK